MTQRTAVSSVALTLIVCIALALASFGTFTSKRDVTLAPGQVGTPPGEPQRASVRRTAPTGTPPGT